MRVISLGSGSSGNALLVEAGPQGRTKVLIDAGFSGRILTQRLRQAGVSPTQLTGILVTHEHIDHILGLPYMMKYHRLPVITDPLTINAIQRWYDQGLDVQTKLPHLATYLGHVSPVSTYYYLRFTPELRRSASQRFHQRFASLFTERDII